MNKPAQMTSLVSALLLTIVLTACGQANAPTSGQTEEPAKPTTQPIVETTPDNAAEPAESDTPDEEAIPETGEDREQTETSARPATETFEMMSEGMPDKRTAELQQGDGYSLYAFDAYTFDAGENKLYLTAYPEYYAEIEMLPSDFNLDELKAEGTNELQEYGEVHEYADDQLAEGPMYGARLLLQVSGEDGLHDYVVWEPEGENGYIFRVHAPSGEASETFLTPALTSLSSVQADAAMPEN